MRLGDAVVLETSGWTWLELHTVKLSEKCLTALFQRGTAPQRGTSGATRHSPKQAYRSPVLGQAHLPPPSDPK